MPARLPLLPACLLAALALGLGGAGVQVDRAEPAPAKVAPDAQEKPWTHLFDGRMESVQAHFQPFEGRRLSGWTVEADGSLHVAGGANLISKQAYGDFELEMEWKAGPNGNSGLFYRIAPQVGQPIYHNAFECQIFAPQEAKTNPVYRAGALYNLFGNGVAESLRPTGEWNRMRVVAEGNRLRHWLNGVQVVDCDLGSPEYAQKLAKSKFRKVAGYGVQKSGPLGLQSDGGEVWFRNIRVRTLD